MCKYSETKREREREKERLRENSHLSSLINTQQICTFSNLSQICFDRFISLSREKEKKNIHAPRIEIRNAFSKKARFK